MSKIHLLDPSVINLIAAGEVVDRPASAVKELVENAMDAGATQITVEIRRGGLGMIRVTDNGCGMSAEDGRNAFLKHATSKIRTKDDLAQIHTLGFRGEALAAISAVSKLTLVTKQPENPSGIRFELSEGKILSEEECGCPDGSTFTVSDLFFNTPARLKFMKSEPAEAGAVQSVMERLALSHPNVSFRFLSNNAERFHTPGRGDLQETVFSVFGKEFAEMTLKADTETGEIRVRGLIGKPIYSKANRGKQVFFLNGRYVRSAILAAGLENAYQNKMLIGRVPVCVLFVEMPPNSVDVNVHPGKLEVKFADENAVAYAVRKAVEEALRGDNGIVEMRIPTMTTQPVPKQTPPPLKQAVTKIQPKPIFQKVEPKSIPTPVPSVQPAKEKTIDAPKTVSVERSGWTITAPKPTVSERKITVADVISAQPTVRTISAPAPIPEIPSQKPEAKKITPPAVVKIVPDVPKTQMQEDPVLFKTEVPFSLIGEAFDCYVLVERGEELLFIDKHALHERMNFERIRKSTVQGQSLLYPLVVNLGIEENRILTENADFLARFAIILESFGDDLLIREIPALIDPEQAEPLLQEFAEALSSGKKDSLLDRFYYDIACKASIRSGSKTSRAELEGLIAEYFRRESELQYCPHGRPIVFNLTKKSIEKQFKRVK